MSLNQDIERRKSDDYPEEITVTDQKGSIIKLTTETFRLGVDTIVNPPGVPDTFTSTGIISDAAKGKVQFPIAGTTAVGNFFFDIEIVDTNGKARTLIDGKYDVIQDIVKS